MNKKLKIGIIGLGGIAHMAHLNAFKKLDGCRITSCCDIDSCKFNRIREEFGFDNFYTDFREMLLKEKLDAVVIGTPNDTHRDMSVFALEHGVNVLCEKPVARSHKEALDIQRAVEKSGNKFMVGQCFRFKNQTEIIKKLILENKLGDIYYCKASYLRQRGFPGFGTWFTDKSRAGGGVTLDLGVHMIDYIWFLLGKPAFKTVSAHTSDSIGKRCVSGEKAGFQGSSYPSTYTGPEKNIFDVDEMASVFVRFENNIAFQLEVAWAINTDKDMGGGTIFGNKGSVTLDPIIYTYDKGDNMVSEEIPFKSISSHDNQAVEFINFLNGDNNPVPIEDSLVVMKVLDAIYKSAQTRCEIKISKGDER